MEGGDGDSPPVDPRLHANSDDAYDSNEGDVGDLNMPPPTGRDDRGHENHVESPQPGQEDVDPRYQIDPEMLTLYDDHEDWRMNGDDEDEELEDPGELVRETTPHEEPEEEESEEDPEKEYEEELEENREEEGLQENFENGEFKEDFDGPVIIMGNIIDNPDGIIEEEEVEEDEEEEELEVPQINGEINHQANLAEEQEPEERDLSGPEDDSSASAEDVD